MAYAKELIEEVADRRGWTTDQLAEIVRRRDADWTTTASSSCRTRTRQNLYGALDGLDKLALEAPAENR